ncbi:MAG TPA: CopD family protein, partial [Thermoleophilia bacterium]
LLYAGLALLVGAASTCILALGRRVPAGGTLMLRGAAVVAVVGLCALVWAERTLVGAQSLLPLFETTEGLYLLALGVALAVCVGAVACVDLWPARWSLIFLGAAGVAAVLAHVLAGHADAPSSLRLVNVAVQWVHMVAVGMWVGGLAWLLLGIRGATKADRAAAVNAFSRLATVTLVVVLLTGLARALVEVGGLANLFGTSYGITLLAKLALVALLVLLGAVNHFRLGPALGGDEGVTRTFRMNARTELAVATAVLAATAVLSGLAPASSAVAQGAASKTATVSIGGDVTMRMTPTVAQGAAGRGVGANRQMVEPAEPTWITMFPSSP